MVLGTVLFYATLIIILNLLVDFLQAWLDPKAREQSMKSDQGSSLTKDAWMRLRSNRMALLSLFILGFILLFSFLGPELCQFQYDEQDLESQFLPPDKIIGLEPIIWAETCLLEQVMEGEFHWLLECSLL